MQVRSLHTLKDVSVCRRSSHSLNSGGKPLFGTFGIGQGKGFFYAHVRKASSNDDRSTAGAGYFCGAGRQDNGQRNDRAGFDCEFHGASPVAVASLLS